ncbi:hypothetical protein GCM10027275_24770 [Rhabdobacter roseus]|uniref:DUF4468 domain-containing protein n=1 Tax=Rhabdobacter roseus TaxID=1655419 RepID=A0A840TRS2_9BACT|nr:DUF4468 domain-containing protein [Rhabdobacter roseus]MBB5284417.1 hypothetical protein [Rhabdobacter roseus]
MKKLFFCLCILVSAPLLAQEPVTYQEVVTAEKLTQAQILEKANQWAVKAFKDYQKTIQYRDTSQVVLNGALSHVTTVGSGLTAAVVPRNYTYQLTVEAKPGRYRLSINNITVSTPQAGLTAALPTRQAVLDAHNATGGGKRMKENLIKSTNDEYDYLDAYFKGVLSSIQKHVADSKDDW